MQRASSDAGIKATAFLSAKRELIVRVVNNTDAAELPPVAPATSGGYADTLPARSLTTYQFTLK